MFHGKAGLRQDHGPLRRIPSGSKKVTVAFLISPSKRKSSELGGLRAGLLLPGGTAARNPLGRIVADP
jgi:hypothetical protein